MTDMSPAVQDAPLVHVGTGEVLEATPANAAIVIEAARAMKRQVDDVIRYATAILGEESRRLGTKTLRFDRTKVSLTGGPQTDYDAVALRDLLRDAGCPEERINEAVVEEISYKVNRNVLKQLRVNDDYAAAIDLAKREYEKPWQAKVET